MAGGRNTPTNAATHFKKRSQQHLLLILPSANVKMIERRKEIQLRLDYLLMAASWASDEPLSHSLCYSMYDRTAQCKK